MTRIRRWLIGCRRWAPWLNLRLRRPVTVPSGCSALRAPDLEEFF